MNPQENDSSPSDSDRFLSPQGLDPNPPASAFVAPPGHPSLKATQGGTDSNLDEASQAPLDERIVAALREIYDPEIPVNIYDLGLIYRVDCDEMGVVEIEMTLTTPGCPVAQTFPGVVEAAVHNVPGVACAQVNLVWEPAWTIDRMSEAAKLELGFF
ncbi:MAG: SUF system Fe-S cluster assembly protein [Ectothiorhodospiraceae bacterium AqS1]|nr:SUF system Fe-S cluster assembly protein [Ectothiorhodospiraceae bacterium AqS1]